MLEESTKTSLSEAAADLQSKIEALGVSWLAVLDAWETARQNARDSHTSVNSLTQGVHRLNNVLSPHNLRNFALECFKANRLRYLVEGLGPADGADVISEGTERDRNRLEPGGYGDLSGRVDRILGGL